jgi:hypothetical protein
MNDKPDGNWWEGPELVLERLLGIFPAFAAHWQESNNLARREDGSFSYCGAFMEFGGFFREQYERLPADCLAALGEFVSECAESSNEELNTAACTCFLENLAGEHFCGEFQVHLTGEALRFYQTWSG